MKRILLLSTLLLASLSLTARAADPYKGIQGELLKDLKANIEASGDNKAEWEKALLQAPKEQKEGIAFLIAYMPAGDRDTLTANFLLEETNWAYKAKKTFPWAKNLPDDIFYNYVLPYANYTENREPWREYFWGKVTPLIEGVTDEREALTIINREIEGLLGVKYNTKRRRADQAPSESIEIGMASCTGLSILLNDALRTVGIPARFAGTPMWVSREGNHSWSEVWLDGQWYVTEYNPGAELNKLWFIDRAGKADKTDPQYWMYAVSWKPTGTTWYTRPWPGNRTPARPRPVINAHDVTDFYIDLYNAQKAEAKDGTPVSIRMYSTQDGGRSSGDRVAMDVRIVDADHKMVAAGKTAGPTQDMNDYLVLYLPAGQALSVEFTDAAGTVHTTPIAMEKEPVEVTLFLK